MGPLPPVGGSPESNEGMGFLPPDHTAEQLGELVHTLRGDMKAFENGEKGTHQIDQVLQQMKSLLENHKQEIEQQVEFQGHSPAKFENFYTSTLHGIDGFLQDPNNGSLDGVNEWATQLHYLMTNSHNLDNIDPEPPDLHNIDPDNIDQNE